MTLNKQQQHAMDAVLEGKHCFISGPGGTGKSYLIEHLAKGLKAHFRSNSCVGITALTGCAALLLGNKAKTIHSWAGIGLGLQTPAVLAANIKKYGKKAKYRWEDVKVLIIDEISMMDPELLDKLDQVGRILRRSQKPFGGIQIIFVGDFFQLPPVRKEREEEPRLPEFAFESETWKEIKPEIILLDEIVRQSDPVFQRVLNEIRYGSVSPESLEILNRRRIDTWQSLEIKPTLLFSRRAEVEMVNQTNIRALKKEGAQTYKVHTDFTAVLEKGLDKQSDIVKRAEAKLDLNAPYKVELELRIGAQVMLITNLDVENGLVNGSRGIVQGFQEQAPFLPLVLFQNTCAAIPIGVASWESEEIEGLKRVQIPLICAWAITIHKSQGATLDSALIDIGPSTFERGQAYVALSRVKRLEALYIWDIDTLAFKAHPKVVAFYNSLPISKLQG